MNIKPIVIKASLKGRAIFQASIINLSYRTRGKEQRTHTKMKQIRNVFIKVRPDPRKKIEVIKLKNIIIPYSLIKIKANKPPPYSILNPETISDSPSAMSKGVRLASAIHSINHTRNSGAENKENQYPCWIIDRYLNE